MNAYAGGYDYPQQQIIQHATCPSCPVCPEWASGILDGFIQWGRGSVPFFDWWLICSAVLGGAMLVIAFPLTRQIIGAVVEVIKTVWNKFGKGKKE